MLSKSLSRNAFLEPIAVALALAFATAGPTEAVANDGSPLPAAEYLSPDDPAWSDLESLWNRGALDGLPVLSRPLPRLDIARSLAGTLEERPALAATATGRRLLREFAFELDALGADPPYPETPPMSELEEDGVLLRGRLEARLGLTTSGDEGHVPLGTRAIASGRAWIPGGGFLRAELALEKIEDDSPLGDSIVKGSPWYLAVEEAYVSFRPGGFELIAGLLEHRWGPGDTGTLLLSDAAASYPSISWARTIGKRARFVTVTGALQSAQKRWFSAHRLEFSLGSRVRIGLHEAAAYHSDGIDLVYVTGLIPYTLAQRILDRATVQRPEAELADRENVSDHRNNVVVGADATWRVGRGVRLDGEFVLDDLATESASQPDRLGYQAGISWSGDLAGRAADVRAEFVKVYRWTYATFYHADLVHDGTALGYGPGPDVEFARLRFERDLRGTWRAGIGIDRRSRGSSPAGEAWSPDDRAPRDAGSALTDPIERRTFPHALLSGTWRDVVRLRTRVGWERVENRGHVAEDDGDAIRTETEVRVRW